VASRPSTPPAPWEGYAAGLDNIAAWLHRFADDRLGLLPVRTAGDIRRAKAAGRVGVVLGWQNASPIEDRLDRLALFHALGVRIIQLTYHFGVSAVAEMNRLGILIDLSHVGDRTSLEAIDHSAGPVTFTHANARAFFDHPRNKTDEALRRLAARGGVIGANAFPPFLRRGFESTVADYVDAIDDLVGRVGIDHVGIGTDYTQDQPPAFFKGLFAEQGTRPRPEPIGYPDPLLHPRGMETPDTLSSVAEELRRRGYDEPSVQKVLGGNWLRLFEGVWGA
jgi:membrane dipeptidase